MTDKNIKNKIKELCEKGIDKETIKKEKDTFAEIKKLQKEFQKKNCPNCINYNIEKRDFITKGHSNNPYDCKYHWTNMLGDCFNYEKRGDFH